jgi:sulfatase modifying factor 1
MMKRREFITLVGGLMMWLAAAVAQPLPADQERTIKPMDSFKECDVCPELVVVPAANFTMGSPASERGHNNSEDPQHPVAITRPLAVGKFEVTVDQFAAFARESGYDTGSKCYTLEDGKVEERDGRSWRNPGYSQEATYPAACLSWNDAKSFVAWLSRKTGKAYRLLTESEWEYAARAGTTSRYYFGDDENELCHYSNGLDQTARRTFAGANGRSTLSCSDGYAYAAPVGSFAANRFGLYDMLGNLSEWVEDCANYSYDGAPTNGSAWTSGDCSHRIVRGGSWSSTPEFLRSAKRDGSTPSGVRLNVIGFRVARTLTP